MIFQRLPFVINPSKIIIKNTKKASTTPTATAVEDFVCMLMILHLLSVIVT